MILKEFFVSLGLDADAQSFARGEIAVKTLELGLHALIRVAEKAFDFFKELSIGTVEYGEHVALTAQKVGVSTDALQELQYAAKLSKISNEELAQGLGFLARNMDAAARGGKEQAAAFARTGVAVKDMHGKLRPAEDVLGDLADHFEDLNKRGISSTALSMQLFGRAGKGMIPMLNEGSKGLEKLRKEAHFYGEVLDKESIEQSKQAGENLSRLSSAWHGIKLSIGSNLIGPLSQAAAWIAKWLALHRQMISSGVKSTFLAIGNSLVLIWHGLEYGYGLLVKLVNYFGTFGSVGAGVAIAFAAAWALAALPIILIAALFGVVLLVLDDIQTALEGGDSLMVRLWDKWSTFVDDWTKPKPGDGWLMLGLKALVHMIMHIGESWDAAVDFWREKFRGFADWVEARFAAIANAIRSVTGTSVDFAKQKLYKEALDKGADPTAIARMKVSDVGYTSMLEGVDVNKLVSMKPANMVGSTTPAGGKNVSNHLDMSGMTIQVIGGEGKAVADAIIEKMNGWWSSKLREAGQ